MGLRAMLRVWWPICVHYWLTYHDDPALPADVRTLGDQFRARVDQFLATGH